MRAIPFTSPRSWVGCLMLALVFICAWYGLITALDDPAALAAEGVSPTGGTAEAPATPTAPIKTGVLVSKFHATGPNWISKPYGYGAVKDFLDRPDVKELDLFPIIEPGTAKDEQVAAILQKYFPNHPPIDATDWAAMRKLDVLVLISCWNLDAKVVDAIDKVVAAGTPLLQQASTES